VQAGRACVITIVQCFNGVALVSRKGIQSVEMLLCVAVYRFLHGVLCSGASTGISGDGDCLL